MIDLVRMGISNKYRTRFFLSRHIKCFFIEKSLYKWNHLKRIPNSKKELFEYQVGSQGLPKLSEVREGTGHCGGSRETQCPYSAP